MCEVDPRHGLYLSLSAAYRGSSLETSTIELNLLNLQNKDSFTLCPGMPINHFTLSAPSLHFRTPIH